MTDISDLDRFVLAVTVHEKCLNNLICIVRCFRI